MVSRSFGTEVRDYDKLANAITMFATDAARSIRTANLVASSTSVFIETNRFGKSPHHAPSRSEALSSPATNNTKHIVRAALAALKHIYREGLAYKRAGVMLLDLVEAGPGAIVKSCVWADHAAARSWGSPSTNLTPRMISARWFDPSSFLHFL